MKQGSRVIICMETGAVVPQGQPCPVHGTRECLIAGWWEEVPVLRKVTWRERLRWVLLGRR